MLLLRHAGQHLPLPVLFFLTLFALAGCGGGGSDTKLDDAFEVDENFAYWAEWVDAV